MDPMANQGVMRNHDVMKTGSSGASDRGLHGFMVKSRRRGALGNHEVMKRAASGASHRGLHGFMVIPEGAGGVLS